MGPMSGGPKRKRPTGLLGMPMGMGMSPAMPPAPKMMKPPVDMAGMRKSIRKRPKKVKVRPTLNADALSRAHGAM